MSSTREVVDILAAAESRLKQLMQQRLEAQAYNEVAAMAPLASDLAALVSKATADPQTQASGNGPNVTVTVRREKSEQRSGGQSRITRPASYPRFCREGDKLVKTGWSKRNRKIYEHRAPKDSVFAFCRLLRNQLHAGQDFRMGNIIGMVDSKTPSYRAYVALGWLRQLGLIEERGHNEFRLTTDIGDDDTLDELWMQTPSSEENENA